MKKHIKITLFIILYVFFSFSLSEANENFSQFTPSTVFTPELSGLFPNTSFNPVEVYTSSDIKLLGVENVPDLLSYIPGVNVYRSNSSTADISIRGFINNFRINPTILIDGMEIRENHYNRSYLYNLPVTIDDIDRIEVIKDPSIFVNGIESPGGVINIVTKKPELLNSNYINIYNGSNNLINSNFSISKYLFQSYFKIVGGFRKIDEYHSNKKGMEKEFISLTGTHFFENSKLFIKTYISNNQLNLFNHLSIGINHTPFSVNYNGKLKNTKLNAFLFDYTTSNTDINFYFQKYYGDANMLFSGGKTKYVYNTASFYKLTLKHLIKYKNLKIITGAIGKHTSTRIRYVDGKKKYSLSVYTVTKFSFLKNFKTEFFIKNKKLTTLGNEFSFKLNTTFTNKDKTFFIKAGYAKNYLNPDTFNQYYDTKLTMEFNNFLVDTYYFPNKKLKPVKIYSTTFDLGKKFKKLELSANLFYNRITGINLIYGTFKLVNFKPVISLTSKNFFNFAVHGFESKLKYHFNKNTSFFTSFYLQHIKDKRCNKQGNYLIPKYKILSCLLFNMKLFSGSIKTIYTPSIHSHTGKNSDVFNIDINLKKAFLKNKIEASIIANNVFKDVGRDNYYGEKRGRNIIFKLKYNF